MLKSKNLVIGQKLALESFFYNEVNWDGGFRYNYDFNIVFLVKIVDIDYERKLIVLDTDFQHKHNWTQLDSKTSRDEFTSKINKIFENIESPLYNVLNNSIITFDNLDNCLSESYIVEENKTIKDLVILI